MTQFFIHPNTRLGYVHLTVTNLERSLAFYQQSLGMRLHRRENETAYLGAGREDLLVLTEMPQARQVRGTTGLYHFAILVPSRLELAQSLKRIAETRVPVDGFSDHGVSEAIYLPDPDGHGIEIYRDRPRAEWPFRQGQLQMTVDPLDTNQLLAELAGQNEGWPGLHPETVLGHVHLHVAHLPEAETFYRTVIGFEVMQRYGSGALFLSAGGYHHHVGLNTWAGVGAPAPPPDAVGLRWFVIVLPDAGALEQVLARVEAAGVPADVREDGVLLRDPAGNGLLLTEADS